LLDDTNVQHAETSISFSHFEYTSEDADCIIYTLSLTSLGVRSSSFANDAVDNVATWFPLRRVRGFSDTRWDPDGVESRH
jgi:hypothetical protein